MTGADGDRRPLAWPEAVSDDHTLRQATLLAAVTHDLRTPLSAIRAVVTDLRDGVPYDERTRQDLLDLACDEIDRLDRLVANLLSMSRLEAGAMTPEVAAVDVADLLRHRAASLGPLLRDLEVVVDVEPERLTVAADFAHLEQVLTNLLGNAARYAPAGSELRLRGRAAGDGEVVVEVVDHGPGVPDALAATLFQPFVTGEGGRATGLGLAICTAVVEANGGRLEVLPTPGGGATFRMAFARWAGSTPPDNGDEAS